MQLKMTKKVDFIKVGKELQGSAVKKIRLEAKNIETGIIKRTLNGKDVNLRAFKDYTPNYKHWRLDNNLNTDVNLFVSGEMLGAIISDKITNGIRFSFSSKSAKDKAKWNMKERNFFGIDKKQKKYLTTQLSKKPKY